MCIEGVRLIQDFTLNLNLEQLQTSLSKFVNDKGRLKSNQGGYQSNLLEPEDMPSQLKKEIDLKVHNPASKLLGWWVNVNGYGNTNACHDHYDRTPPAGPVGISGVFYISVPEKNMGDILFQGTMLRSHPTLYDPPLRYDPKPNRLLIFPSDCCQSGESNQSNKKRMSLAFNYT